MFEKWKERKAKKIADKQHRKALERANKIMYNGIIELGGKKKWK